MLQDNCPYFLALVALSTALASRPSSDTTATIIGEVVSKATTLDQGLVGVDPCQSAGSAKNR